MKLADECRSQWNGLYVYAIDGQQLILPLSKEIRDAGYTGRAVSKHSESHYPRGYLTHVYDVLSGMSKDIRFGPRLYEQGDAVEMVPNLETNSLTIYDRLYCCKKLIRAHKDAGNFYLFRLREGALKDAQVLFKKTYRTQIETEIDGEKVVIVKIRNPHKKDGQLILATNLPKDKVTKKSLEKLYYARWEVETSFKELTGTFKLEQWHSKSTNGIYQELYALFWLINFVKLQIHKTMKKPKNLLRSDYKRANFKAILNWVLNRFGKILKRIQRLYFELRKLIKKSTERRKHLSRSFPRHLRCPASPYKYNNTHWAFSS